MIPVSGNPHTFGAPKKYLLRHHTIHNLAICLWVNQLAEQEKIFRPSTGSKRDQGLFMEILSQWR
jgi:hypothetical protein